MDSPMDVRRAMRERISTRSFTGQPIEPARLSYLLEAAVSAQRLLDPSTRVDAISGLDLTKRVLTMVVGSYGLVQNVPHLLAGILPGESEEARVDLGYVLEQVVLQATMLGLGTCWITGTFDSGAARSVLGTGSAEVVAGVCALGEPAVSRIGRFHTDVVRRLAGAHKRKPLSELVYAERWGGRLPENGLDPSLATILDLCRLAPSAANGQPWRFIVREGSTVLALTRRKPIDAGIVMSHFTLAAQALGVSGAWRLRWADNALAHDCDLPSTAVAVGVFA